MNDDSSFHGLPVRTIRSAHLRLDVLAGAGPRIVRLSLGDSDRNLLAELPDVGWDTTEGRYNVRGGHRLWHAPESFPRTYLPYDDGVLIEPFENRLRLTRPADRSGIRTSMLIELDPERPALTVTHTLTNAGLWPVELAPWAITMLPLGGVAVAPTDAAPGPNVLLPDRHLVAWPYTRWRDPRLTIDDNHVMMRGESLLPPCKIGLLSHAGWLAYLRDGVLFVKRFTPQPGATHADRNCNLEIFCNDQFLELESLGPLVLLAPGDHTTHVERWQCYADVPDDSTPEAIAALVDHGGDSVTA
jgi:hypothetical protein